MTMGDVTASGLRIEVGEMLANGVACRIRYFTASGATAGYDDDVAFSESGSAVWASGLVQPVGGRRGSNEALLLQQGRLLNGDKKIYFDGSVSLSGAALKIGIGSPTPVEHYIIPDGVSVYDVNNQAVYKKVFVRRLTNGSFIGEA